MAGEEIVSYSFEDSTIRIRGQVLVDWKRIAVNVHSHSVQHVPGSGDGRRMVSIGQYDQVVVLEAGDGSLKREVLGESVLGLGAVAIGGAGCWWQLRRMK